MLQREMIFAAGYHALRPACTLPFRPDPVARCCLEYPTCMCCNGAYIPLHPEAAVFNESVMQSPWWKDSSSTYLTHQAPLIVC